MTALKPKWRERFEFFEASGAPGSPEARAAFKALPVDKKCLISISWLGFFFGPLYFTLVLGMWKRTATLIGIILVAFPLVIILLVLVFEVFWMATGSQVSHAVQQLIVQALNIGVAMLFALTANYSYYLKEVKDDNGWNPFKGLRTYL